MEEDILKIIDLQAIPPTDIIYGLLGICSRCFEEGHNEKKCVAIPCSGCRNFKRACFCVRMARDHRHRGCQICNSSAHDSNSCLARLWCSRCLFMGHLKIDCDSDYSVRLVWQPKVLQRTKMIHSDFTARQPSTHVHMHGT